MKAFRPSANGLLAVLILSSGSQNAACVKRKNHDPEGSAFKAASFLADNYGPDCNLKFIQDGPEGHSWAQEVIKRLEDVGSQRPISVFQFTGNQTYTDPRLDLFLRWEKKSCTVNVLYLGNSHADTVAMAVNFTVKLSSRDRSSLYFLAYDGEDSKRAWLRERLRNFKSACLLSLRTMEVDCVEDEASQDQKHEATTKDKRERPMSGRTLRVNAEYILPIVAWTVDSKTGEQIKEGVHYTMLQTLSKSLNVSAVLSEPEGGANAWGSLIKGNTDYNGMVGHVARSDVDMAIGSFFYVLVRAYGVSYVLHSAGCSSLLTPREARVQNWVAVSNVFDKATWIALAVALLAFIAIFLSARLFERTRKAGRTTQTRSSQRFFWPDAIAHGLGTLMRRGDFQDEYFVFRVFIHAWIMVGFAFFGIFFRSILIQKLTTIDYERPVNSIQDLAARQIPVQYNPLCDILHAVYPHLRLDKLVDRSYSGDKVVSLRNISRGMRTAIFMADEEAYFLQRTKFWDVVNDEPLFNIAKTCYLATSYGWIVPKHSYYEEKVQATLARYQEAGLMTKWKDDLVETKKQVLEPNVHTRDDSVRALKLDDLSWVFYWFAYAQSVCALSFCLEWARFFGSRRWEDTQMSRTGDM